MSELPLSKLATALAKAQRQIEGAKRSNLNPAFRGSKYADLASVWDACREELTANGLSVVQQVVEAPDGFIGLETILLHESGENLLSRFSMPVKDKTNPQAVGSAITYARRYALMAVVGIAPEDDDGNSASGARGATKPPQQPERDWQKLASEAREQASSAPTAPEKRALYAQVRSSQMPEPLKTETLSAMADHIKTFEAAEAAKATKTEKKGK